jgi:hypothetical protein
MNFNAISRRDLNELPRKKRNAENDQRMDGKLRARRKAPGAGKAGSEIKDVQKKWQ